ncbi:hypothetical protein [Streptomyces sp. LMG1-1-1.1]|uniref:hypothetical protein n=1 Tax=Streptomyces sp. LMG1-1-1.1 TaxID=3135245 RepID=UPI0034667498
MSGPDDGRTFARMLWVSMVVLVLEAAVTWVGNVVLAGPGEDRLGLLPAFRQPSLLTAWFLGLLLAVVFLVIPTVWLAEELERRFGGRADGWTPAVAALAATVPVLPRALTETAGPAAGAKAWLTGALVLTVAALAARRAGRIRALRVKAPAPTN